MKKMKKSEKYNLRNTHNFTTNEWNFSKLKFSEQIYNSFNSYKLNNKHLNHIISFLKIDFDSNVRKNLYNDF